MSEKSGHFRRVKYDTDVSNLAFGDAPTDYFRLLNVELDATDAVVREGYRKLQRLVHPDLAGEDATELAAHINIAYATLSDPHSRAHYADMVRSFRAQMGTFNGLPVSEWCGADDDTHALFIDETLCIGCRQCTFFAPQTFILDELHGRARVAKQWADERGDIRDAMDLCPVTCIHLVPRTQVALLEYVMKACKREDTAILARRRTGNMPSSVGDNPFSRAETYVKRTTSSSHMRVEATKTHDHLLAAAIARAWRKVPDDILVQGWPQYMGMVEY